MSFVAAAILGGAALGAGASIVSARQGGKATEGAARRAADTELAMYDQSREDLAPWRESGVGALNILNDIYGIPRTMTASQREAAEPVLVGDTMLPAGTTTQHVGNGWYKVLHNGKWIGTLRPGGPNGRFINETGFDVQGAMAAQRQQAETAAQPGGATGAGPVDRTGGFFTSPGFQFRVDEDRKAIERSAASRGRLFTPATARAVGDRAQLRASDEWNNFLQGLRAQAGIGQAATSQGVGANLSTGGALANIYQNQGAQRASSFQQLASGVNSAVQGGIGNYLFMDALKKRPVGAGA